MKKILALIVVVFIFTSCAQRGYGGGNPKQDRDKSNPNCIYR